MRRILILLLLLAGTASAESFRWSFGGFYGAGGNLSTDFDNGFKGQTFGGMLGYRLSDKWRVTADVTSYDNDKLNVPASITDSLTFLPGSTADFTATRYAVLFRHNFRAPEAKLNFELGLGGGMLCWKINDPTTDTPYDAVNKSGSPTKFKANEVIGSAMFGIVIAPAPRLSFHIESRIDYQTSAGASFSSKFNDYRGRALASVTIGLQFHFSSRNPKPAKWTSDSAWTAPPNPVRRPIRSILGDSDEDGVPDDIDRCLSTPFGAVVDKTGCPIDSDRDGVYDGLDDCPGTPPKAAGTIDMFGCPIDSDFDGIPDYLDACPFSPVGAIVDSTGCPIDSDNDGVPDGLDDCPYTLPAVKVDAHGCIDMAIFAKPMILYIDYPPGSFEIDPNSRERLKKLAGLLTVVTDIKLEVNGYTDNIGTDIANQKLSEKRAMRVRDYLVTLGVASDRMKAFGRGEVNQIASNDTSDGRAKNRRIELVFYR